jgi:hypothetical protein
MAIVRFTDHAAIGQQNADRPAQTREIPRFLVDFPQGANYVDNYRSQGHGDFCMP